MESNKILRQYYIDKILIDSRRIGSDLNFLDKLEKDS